ncbi:MAG: bifunctional 2-C-methyl-D-erythritol 4-phosphate cytidylyltransferase/2-C-methyl-D-erythritol 2,4-cyclodiphosphate synthase [Croceibacterium sp.]
MDPAPVAPFAAIIAAAGTGSRAGLGLPKQFAEWRGSTVLGHAARALRRAGAGTIMVTHPADFADEARRCLAGIAGVALTPGGATRQVSVRHALEKLAADAPDIVLVHDAARPDCPAEVVERLLGALADCPAAIPVLPIVDSVAIATANVMGAAVDRASLRRVQTPQAFRFSEILAAHRAWPGDPVAGDDAQVAQAFGLPVTLVAGDERLRKLTTAEDFASMLFPRTGTGFDAHRLAQGEELWLCGIRIAHDRGLAGHSDADVALHAVVDAILGACGAGDIGLHFPPGDPQWHGASSARFVEHAIALANEAGFGIGNVDLTIICEAPKIGPERDAMRARLAELLGIAIAAVNVKATTTERMGFTGRGEGIAAQAVATLVPLQRT